MSQTNQESSSTGAILPTVIQAEAKETQSAPSEADLSSHLKDLGWQDGSELLGEAVSGIPVFGSAIKKLIEIGTGTGKYSPEQRLVTLNWKWLLEQVEDIQNRLDILLEKLPEKEQPQPADIAAVMKAIIDVSEKTADYRKRRLLKHALVNAFDIEQYRAGLTLRLVAILKDLEYGDVEFLGRISKTEKAVVDLGLDPVGFQSIVDGDSGIVDEKATSKLVIELALNPNLELTSARDRLSSIKTKESHKLQSSLISRASLEQIFKANRLFKKEDLSITSLMFHHLSILEQQGLVLIEQSPESSDKSNTTRHRKGAWQQMMSDSLYTDVSHRRNVRIPQTTELGKRFLHLLLDRSKAP